MPRRDELLGILNDLRANIGTLQLEPHVRLPIEVAIVELLDQVEDPMLDQAESVRDYVAYKKSRLDTLKTILGAIETFKKVETERIKQERELVKDIERTTRALIQDLKRNKLDIYVDSQSDTPGSILEKLQGYERDVRALGR